MSSHKNSVLIVDDDQDALASLARALNLNCSIHLASNAKSALEKLEKAKPDVMILDLSLDDKLGVESGYSVLKSCQQLSTSCRTIVLTGHGTTEYGIRALQLGAASFLEKPADISHLRALVSDGIAQSNLKQAYLKIKDNSPEPGLEKLIVGSSPVANKIREDLKYAAFNNMPVLITGETGTGKGLCAKVIHDLSSRSKAQFVRYQPFLGSADLIASDLFGHRKGAFTGAEQNREGLLKFADQGTLFLDEIDQLPLETQVTLLGALQDKTYRQVGVDKEVYSDFRLISATNGDIEKCLSENKIRSDFYHRIAHLIIKLEPLRNRLEDITSLSQFFLEKLQSNENLNVYTVEEEAVNSLKNYSWPGNIRELEAIISSAAYRAQYEGHTSIAVRHVSLPISLTTTNATEDLQTQVQKFKKELAKQALGKANNDQGRAATLLGINRSTLWRILESK